MIQEDKNITDYSPSITQLVESTLLEVWGRLGEYREYLVLIGGLAPRYITAQTSGYSLGDSSHCGTMDIDLGVSLAVSQGETYRSIHRILKEAGFRYARNDDGTRKSHTFEIDVKNRTISLDFLTTAYSGLVNRHVVNVEHELSAIKVKGLGLALQKPRKVHIRGRNLRGDVVEENIMVCRPIAYIILKIFAFDGRHLDKDSYDLVYTLLNYKKGPISVAFELLSSDIVSPSFQTGLEMLRTHYASLEHDGPRAYSRFVQRAQDTAVAYAAVQQFLTLVKEKNLRSR